MKHSDRDEQREGPLEIPLVGDLSENEADWSDKLLGVEPGGECILYFDSLGGCPYGAIALMSLILLRDLRATGVVTGECSSAALWPFAACRRRLVTPLSILLFHPMKWQSEENVALMEAAEWARHFGQLESDMDQLLVDLFAQGAAPASATKAPRPASDASEIHAWIRAGRYVTGRELAGAGLAELIELKPLSLLAARRAPPG